MCFLIDTFNRFVTEGNEVFQFEVNGNQYCVRRVALEWGQPIIQHTSIEDARQPQWFTIYETLDDALAFVRKMKKLNG